MPCTDADSPGHLVVLEQDRVRFRPALTATSSKPI